MAVLAISYDLHRETGRDYKILIEAIKATGKWCHPVESTWFVVSPLTPHEMHVYLEDFSHARDKIIINLIGRHSWWSQQLPKDVLVWLHDILN